MNCLWVHCLQCLMPGIQVVGQGQLVTYITCYYFCWSLAETILHGVQFNVLWCQWESLPDFSALGCSPLLENSKKPLGFQSLKLGSDLFRNSANIQSFPHRPFSVPVLRKTGFQTSVEANIFFRCKLHGCSDQRKMVIKCCPAELHTPHQCNQQRSDDWRMKVITWTRGLPI